MGVFDKLKNVFFEEEYVEVEEPIKKPKKEKQTIAKKIDLPEMPKVHEDKSEREKEIEEEVVERVEKRGISERELRRERNESGFRFPMTFEDDDFTVDEKPIRKEQPVREREEVKQPSYQDVYGSKKVKNFINKKNLMGTSHMEIVNILMAYMKEVHLNKNQKCLDQLQLFHQFMVY